VLSKLEWFDRGGRVSQRQWADVRSVLDIHRSSLDLDYLHRWAESLGVADLLERALNESS
jgi:hypothetical protein